MARNGRPDEWSCPLCTLLNAWRDRRCAACDNERPAALEAAVVVTVPAPARAVEAEKETENATQPHHQQQEQQQRSFVYREASGVFFSSAPGSTSSTALWRQEPRLQVNRRRRNTSTSTWGPVRAASDTVPAPRTWSTEDRQHVKPVVEQNAIATGGNGVANFALSTSDDMDEDVDVPCFNLLGPGMGMFPTMTGDPPVPEERNTMDRPASEQFTEARQVDRCSTEAQHTEPLRPDYSNGFIPASRVVNQEDRAVEEKLASAGLDLSDSDEDDGKPNRLRRTKRPLSPMREDGQELRTSGPSWECPVCTNFNGAHLSSCELCDTPKAQDNECSICAKILSPSATRCDRCGTPRDQGNELIDLASSPEDKRSAAPDRNDNYDSDFENPYAPAPFNDADDYPQYLGETRGGYDSIEEISDNEAIAPYSRPTNLRPDLKGFDHFVCVEDLRGDYGCKVDYRSMFTGGRTGKSYADRLAARRRESQKRKREAAKKDDLAAAGGTSKPARQTKPKAGKKGKAAVRRRASTGTKRQRKGGTEDRRSSAPTTSSSVNYYNSNSLDFGEDVRTMAWEGVGSASYY